MLAGIDTDAVNAAMGYRYPAGAVRRLDDVLLAVFGPMIRGTAGQPAPIALLENRFRKIGG